MKLTASQYAQALMDTLEQTKSDDHDKVLDNFAQVLAANNDLPQFDNIAKEFARLEKAKKGIKTADVATAAPIDKHTEKIIIEELNRMVAGQVELNKTVDPNLIGGIVVRLEDTLIDGSVKKSLEDLKHNLTE